MAATLLSPKQPEPPAVNLRFEPFGAARQLFEYQGPEAVLSGPAGTGKSIACLYKLHFLASRVPGFRGLIVRKTRVSLTESGLVTFEGKVLPPRHPALAGPSRAMRQVYRYPNGAEIIVGGMDKASKIMSTEFDLVWVQEAIELTENDWESLTTRLRNGKLPYQQLLADTNPDSPRHWLKRRCDAGRCLLLESRHEDNPSLWDRGRREWTLGGRKYIEKLDALTGARYHRLRKGKWVQAEGVVYDVWDRAVHVIDPFEVPRDWPRYWSIDFGFTNPFVAQFWAEDADGRLYLYREIYQTQRLVEDHAWAILEAAGAIVDGRELWLPGKADPRPQAVVCDTDAEDRATLERHLGMKTTAAPKDVSPGIQAVAARLKVAGDGKPRLFVFRDAVVRRDQALEEAKKPCCTEEEIDGYVWDRKAAHQGREEQVKEEPLKVNDHGCDAARYLVYWLDRGPSGYDEPVAGRRRVW